jgi:hypothetical protein
LALEENPLKLLKGIWPGRKEVLEIMKKKMPQRNLRCGKESYCK